MHGRGGAGEGLGTLSCSSTVMVTPWDAMHASRLTNTKRFLCSTSESHVSMRWMRCRSSLLLPASCRSGLANRDVPVVLCIRNDVCPGIQASVDACCQLPWCGIALQGKHART
jgi:hypothetical protein